MRDKEAALGRKKYKYCLIRIRFPDGFILQGNIGKLNLFEELRISQIKMFNPNFKKSSHTTLTLILILRTNTNLNRVEDIFFSIFLQHNNL